MGLGIGGTAACLAIMGGVFFLLAAHAYKSGAIHGTGGPTRREDHPIFFWFGLLFLVGMGLFCFLLAWLLATGRARAGP